MSQRVTNGQIDGLQELVEWLFATKSVCFVTRSPLVSGLVRSLMEEKQWAAVRTQSWCMRVPVQLPPGSRAGQEILEGLMLPTGYRLIGLCHS